MSWKQCENAFLGAMSGAENHGDRQLAFGLSELTKQLQRMERTLERKIKTVEELADKVRRQTR